MKRTLSFNFILVLGWIMLQPFLSIAQITAPAASYTTQTNYTTFSETDQIYIFCSMPNNSAGALQGNTNLAGSKTFDWQKYNPISRTFEFYSTENSTGNQSPISNLENGCYRLTVTQGATSQVYRAWVFNNWNTANAAITESNCTFFALEGKIGQAALVYYDLATHTEIQLAKNVTVQWLSGETVVSVLASPKIFNPPTKNTDYKLVVNDRFGCQNSSMVTYTSIVTKAAFTADPVKGEAPLEVKFTNTSENGDPAGFEWFFFKDLDQIKRESAKVTQPIDSIMLVAYDLNPVFIYEKSGTYMVKLVSKKVSQLHTCRDTAYLANYIVADTSFISVPNVFTPNGDDVNDKLVVKFWSMQRVKITIVNRWGRTVHVWESGDVRGFENTWERSAWDGRINGRFASPGVYFYVVEGTGRDGAKRWKRGFIHLFRDKD